LSAKIDNVLDERYYSVASSRAENTVGVPNNGMTFMAGIKVFY
jgi:outer membrane receptor protein involved in Fe transport